MAIQPISASLIKTPKISQSPKKINLSKVSTALRGHKLAASAAAAGSAVAANVLYKSRSFPIAKINRLLKKVENNSREIFQDAFNEIESAVKKGEDALEVFYNNSGYNLKTVGHRETLFNADFSEIVKFQDFDENNNLIREAEIVDNSLSKTNLKTLYLTEYNSDTKYTIYKILLENNKINDISIEKDIDKNNNMISKLITYQKLPTTNTMRIQVSFNAQKNSLLLNPDETYNFRINNLREGGYFARYVKSIDKDKGIKLTFDKLANVLEISNSSKNKVEMYDVKDGKITPSGVAFNQDDEDEKIRQFLVKAFMNCNN